MKKTMTFDNDDDFFWNKKTHQTLMRLYHNFQFSTFSFQLVFSFSDTNIVLCSSSVFSRKPPT